MCQLVVALGAHPDFPFVVAANRDEYSDRPFSDPALHPDGTLCGIDAPSGGTWLGVHPGRGHFAALTNIGGRGGPGAMSRGTLTRAFVQDPRAATARLRDSRAARGFNLVWSEDIRAARPRLYYASNCNPDDRGEPSIIELGAEGSKAGRIIGLGNDLLGDEHIKSPWLEQRVRSQLDALPRVGATTRQALARHAVTLRDQLAVVMSQASIQDYAWSAMLDKFVRWSRRRRLQPGARTALGCAALLGAGAGLWLGTPLAAVAAATAGVGVGLWHHARMQHMFVDVCALTRRWTTVAQTIVLVDRRGALHLFARRTVHGRAHPGPWVLHGPIEPTRRRASGPAPATDES